MHIGVHVITIGCRLRSSSGFGPRTDLAPVVRCRLAAILVKGHQLHPLRMRTTHRSTGSVNRLRPTSFPAGCRSASRRQPPSNRRRRRSTLFRLRHVGRVTDEPFNTRRPCFPSGCIKSVQWLALVRAASSLSTFRQELKTECLSLQVEFTVT